MPNAQMETATTRAIGAESAATVQDCRQEAAMNKQNLTILYARLSRDDGEDGVSNSIKNQYDFLTAYAERNGFTPYKFVADDSVSGTTFDRPGWNEVIADIEAGKVANLVSKDASRLGRDYLRMGLYREMFHERGVRLICVNDGVDTAKGEDDFTPFREIINEWYARDTSRKIRAINGSRTANGKHVTGAVPYGYLRDAGEKSRWILDEEAAPIVQRIYRMTIDGKGITQIADTLTAEGVLIPSAHWAQVGAGMRRFPDANPTKWSASCISAILEKEEYMGWAVLNKSIKETYKSKRRNAAAEDRLIFKDAHPAIVDEETWNIAQRLRETKRVPQRFGGDPHPLTGVLYCADCGHKMHHKRGNTGRDNQPHDEYVCSSYRHTSRSCTCHYIKIDAVEKLILTAIRRVTGYVRENQAEFMERVREASAVQQEAAVKDNKKRIAKSKRRFEEVGVLVKKLYEGYALGKIPEENFTELLAGYNDEKAKLESDITELQTAIDTYAADSVRADNFIELVKRYTEFPELTPQILNEFVERVVVYEADKSSGKRTQRVDIHLSFIGNFDLPFDETEEPAEEEPRRVSTKKLRIDMTESERQAERERDRRRYANKVAGKKAAKQAERAAILAGTSYAV